MHDFLADPVKLAMNRILAITANELFQQQMTRHWAPILAGFQKPIREAQQAGHMPAGVDVEMVVMMLISTLLARMAFIRTPADDAMGCYPGD